MKTNIECNYLIYYFWSLSSSAEISALADEAMKNKHINESNEKQAQDKQK